MSPIVFILIGLAFLLLVTSKKSPVASLSAASLGASPLFAHAPVRTNREIEHEQDVAMLDAELATYKRNEHAKAVLSMMADVAASRVGKK